MIRVKEKGINLFVLTAAVLPLFCLAAGCVQEKVGEDVPGALPLYSDNEMLVARLHHLEEISKGRIELEVVGETGMGQDIYLAKAGSGEIPVVLISQQHGSERNSTETLMQLLEKLALSDDPVIANIIDKLTLYAFPRVNMDGGEADKLTYVNVDPVVPPRSVELGVFGVYKEGWNINRYHVLDWGDHPLSQYEEPALQTNQLGFVAAKLFANSKDGYKGIEGNIIDCGEGTDPADFPALVEGNIALIQRGAGSFDAVARLAQDAGAMAVLFYQDKDYEMIQEDLFLPRFELATTLDIPVMTIPRPDALEIIESESVVAEIFTLSFPENPIPEVRAVNQYILDLNPLWLMDIHDTSSYVSANFNTITKGLDWGAHQNACPGTVHLGQQMCVVMNEYANGQYPYAEIALYENPTPSPELNCVTQYSAAGIGTVLIELWAYRSPVYAPMINKLGSEQILAVMEKTADGSLTDVDPDKVQEISRWGFGVDYITGRNTIEEIYMGHHHRAEINAAVAAIEDLPDTAEVSLSGKGKVEDARAEVQRAFNLGIPAGLIPNLPDLYRVEKIIDNIYGKLYTRQSLLEAGELSAPDYSNLSCFLEYGNQELWKTGVNIGGLFYDPLRTYVARHQHLEQAPRWIEYDISNQEYDFLEGYVGIPNSSQAQVYPLNFSIFVDGELVFEALLKYLKEPAFYRLELREARQVKFQLSAASVDHNSYANCIAVVEPMFLAPVAAETAVSIVEALIDELPGDITETERDAVLKARYLADAVSYLYGGAAEIDNLSALGIAETALDGLY